MKTVSPIERTILEKESSKRGGMLVMLWGEQGSMKTMSLTRMVMYDMGVDNVGDDFQKKDVRRIPLWKAQKSCQWILLAAQKLPITLWMHESVEDFHFKLTGSKKSGLNSRKINIEEMDGLDIEIKNFADTDTLVENLDPKRVNAYFIPGSGGSEKDKYFYQRKTCDLCRSLNERDYGDHVTLNWDEVQNEAPDKTNGDFYELQLSDFPSEWEDFRKNYITLRGTGHSHNEVNWKLHKNKVTGTVYLRKGQVHSRHTQVSQKEVNRMEPGDFVVDGFEAGNFNMPLLPQKHFDWFPDHDHVRLQMKVEYDAPDIRPKEKEVDEWIDDRPFSKDEIEDLISLNDAVDLTSIGKTALKQRIYNGSVNAVKVENKHWVLSASQLINNSDVPIEE